MSIIFLFEYSYLISNKTFNLNIKIIKFNR